MKVIMKCSFILIIFFSSGCIFSGSDLEEKKVVDNYYINLLGSNSSLVYREPGAATDKMLISSNIDSIGWNEQIVVGVTNNKYFIVNRQSRAVNTVSDYFQFTIACKSLGSENLHMKKVEFSQMQ